jgi:tetratricopeptide (TPR) repeat protein
MAFLLAALLVAQAAPAPGAPATILVVPFALKDGAPAWAGVAVAESVLDVVVQANQDNFITLKQLDAVLRRRDLRLDDPRVRADALDLARAAGATDLITGEVGLKGETWSIGAVRIRVADGSVVDGAQAQGGKALLAAIAQKAGRALLGVEGQEGPLTRDLRALELAARCEADLARQSLGVHSRMTLAGESLESAEATCKGALAADPKLGLARAGLAVTLAVRGKLAEARKEAQRAQKDRFVPLAVLAEAFAARKQRDAAAWRAILSQAVEKRPGFLHALGYLAEDAIENGEDQEALALFDRYLRRSPNHTWAMGKKARQLARLGQTDEAIELSEKALSLNPGDPELLIETASRYIDGGRDPRAEPLLRQAMDAKPPRPLAALRLGYLYIRGHKLPQAREALEKCLAMATRDDEARTRGIAHADLARISAKQNRYPDAVAELEKARAEGNNRLPCDEPELARWKDRPELKRICVEAAAAAVDEHADDDVVPVDL